MFQCSVVGLLLAKHTGAHTHAHTRCFPLSFSTFSVVQGLYSFCLHIIGHAFAIFVVLLLLFSLFVVTVVLPAAWLFVVGGNVSHVVHTDFNDEFLVSVSVLNLEQRLCYDAVTIVSCSYGCICRYCRSCCFTDVVVITKTNLKSSKIQDPV